MHALCIILFDKRESFPKQNLKFWAQLQNPVTHFETPKILKQNPIDNKTVLMN